MQLSYFHVADHVPEGPLPDVAVVIDVLRATTTIACALKNGAEAVQVFSDIEQLKESAAQWPKPSRLLLGERGGKRLEGFDLGNSPVEVVPEIVSGKRLFMSTTNGTRSLQRVREVDSLYTLALPNRKAVFDKILLDQPTAIWIVGSGWQGDYSLEDSFAAGAFADLVVNHTPATSIVVNDELVAAMALWDTWKHDPEACLRRASHGQRLMKLGNHDDDFTCCSELDAFSVVPFQSEPGVLKVS